MGVRWGVPSSLRYDAARRVRRRQVQALLEGGTRGAMADCSWSSWDETGGGLGGEVDVVGGGRLIGGIWFFGFGGFPVGGV